MNDDCGALSCDDGDGFESCMGDADKHTVILVVQVMIVYEWVIF